ncbi:MAG TPA: hypothetical protein VIL48_16930 [Acidimicrobiales bacterium]
MSDETNDTTGGSGSADSGKDEIQFHYVLRCPCGQTLTGLTEDEIVDVSFAHLREVHPDMANEYEREHILFMAQRLVR